MTTYKLLITRLKIPPTKKPALFYADIFESKILPKTFSSLKDARMYAIRMMDKDIQIHDIQISNPHYMDVWQVYMGVARAENGKYYWSASKRAKTIGIRHYLNKDGTINENIYYPIKRS